ncbi:MAG: hypothetical protein K2W94_04085 [Alphaproteobacteria bacterium]|nr:hypothetical protein [Alphaproteobacteria bacterium]
MFQQISILIILLLGMVETNSRLSSDEETIVEREQNIAQRDLLREALDLEIKEIKKVSGRKLEKLLRANDTIYILARYTNALWNYHILKVLNRDEMEFVEIDLGGYLSKIASAQAENNVLCLIMKNGERYKLEGNELVYTPQ